MEKFIVNKSQRKTFAHAKRISDVEVLKDGLIELPDGRVAYSIIISEDGTLTDLEHNMVNGKPIPFGLEV